jgi:hypothetical protein
LPLTEFCKPRLAFVYARLPLHYAAISASDSLPPRRAVWPTKYAPAQLIGREDETQGLSESWQKTLRLEKGRPHVLTFVALGGEGKTALVAKWAAELATPDWPGCDAAFAWSFDRQGTPEQQAASSDLFIKEAINFFGDDADKAFAASDAGAFEKTQHLGRLVGQRRSLLILDGLEPLQYAPTAPTPGELKDQGLAALLKGLAQNSQGLGLATTRYSLPDLKAFWQTAAPEVKLLRLSRDAGVHLLKTLGVKGSELRNVPPKEGDEKSEKVNEFEKLVEDVKGHALTLTLLGSYLHDAHGGDIRKRDLVKLEEADAEEQGGHAFHVMKAYEHAFERGGDKGQRALSILRLLGLFDRPMTAECFSALLKAPAIPGLTDPLVGVSGAQRNIAIKRLEDSKLVTVHRDAAGALVSLDAHPLLCEYFAKQLREQQPDAWQAAHRRLYEHLCKHKEGDQPMLEDLQPLYQAVAHGCQAGLEEDALIKVYDCRIKRQNENYAWHKLGAFGQDLAAVMCFFETPWSRVWPALTADYQGWLQNQAAFCLRALGRTSEALEPMRCALETSVREEDWPGAARIASNLSEVELTQGFLHGISLGGVELTGALPDAELSVIYADHSGDARLKLVTRAAYADILHQAGRLDDANLRFTEAERMQTEFQPEYQRLYWHRGFQYCELLLAAPERAAWRLLLDPSSGIRNPRVLESCRAVFQRATQTLTWAIQDRETSRFGIALNYLTLGRVALYEAILQTSEIGDWKLQIEQAIAGLRQASQVDYIPRALLTRAWLRVLEGHRTGRESAQADLDEAWEVAERGPMRLHVADIHLHRARLFGVERGTVKEEKYPWESPAADLAAARKLIEQCGYWRRQEELEDAEGRLRQPCS